MEAADAPEWQSHILEQIQAIVVQRDKILRLTEQVLCMYPSMLFGAEPRPPRTSPAPAMSNPVHRWVPHGGGVISHCTLSQRLQVSALHHETIVLYITVSTQHPISLGLPWLELHNPQVSWTDKQVTQWSPYCLSNCLNGPAAPLAATTVESPMSRVPVMGPQRGIQQGESKRFTTTPSLRLHH